MKNYYRISYRGFANEDIIISAESAEAKARAQAEIDKCNNDPNAWGERITRKEAERITAENRRAYRNGSANANNPAGATQIEEW